MIKAISLAILAGGLLLIIFGVNALNSFSSDVSRVLTGAPTEHSIWLLVGGLVMGVAGLLGLLSGPEKG